MRRRLLLALFGFCLAPATVFAQAAPVPLVESENAFALGLYAKLDKSSGNVFFSPYSVAAALGMVYAGATGKTAVELARVLHLESLHAGADPRAAYLLAVKKQAPIDTGGGTNFSSANALWGAAGYKFNQDYVDTIKTVFGGLLTPLDFSKPVAAADTINDWVAGKTNNKILNLISPGEVGPGTRLILTNAVYFKANWTNPFSSDETSPAVFHLNAGHDIQVPTMHMRDNFAYADGDSAKLLTLAYGASREQMVIILPDKTDGLAGVEKNLTAAKLEAWLAAGTSQDVILALPKFKTESSFDLSASLAAMGIVAAFDPVHAQLSGIVDSPGEPIFISDVIHKSYIDVDEKGTEAAAATAIVAVAGAVMAPGPPPPPPIMFICDHPFLYLIRDGETGQILFMGRVVDPSVGGEGR